MAYDEVLKQLTRTPQRWLITGVAGFIGSHLLERLLRSGQEVVGLDNFATGYRANMVDVARRVGANAYSRFKLIDGDIRDPLTAAQACYGVDIVLHQAALGSVPRSMQDPRGTHAANVDGFVNVLLSARRAGVRRIVYASSSSVYGDDPELPKLEGRRGRPLSPYAASKLIDEIYADTFWRTHGIDAVGLRYFNVFGPRQDPNGAYAAVIPRWVERLLNAEPCAVFGDASTSRDFCFVSNVVQANLLAALLPSAELDERVFNVACEARTSLDQLFVLMRSLVARYKPEVARAELVRQPARPGDIRHSLASIERARRVLGYRPEVDVAKGMQETVRWYADHAELGIPLGTKSSLPEAAQEAS